MLVLSRATRHREIEAFLRPTAIGAGLSQKPDNSGNLRAAKKKSADSAHCPFGRCRLATGVAIDYAYWRMVRPKEIAYRG
jgi:hypothetical protein